MHSARPPSTAVRGRRQADSARIHPPMASVETMAYIRASVAKRTANGDHASRTTEQTAARRPATRLAATNTNGIRATAKRPDRARTAVSPSPNSRIHPCRRM